MGAGEILGRIFFLWEITAASGAEEARTKGKRERSISFDGDYSFFKPKTKGGRLAIVAASCFFFPSSPRSLKHIC